MPDHATLSSNPALLGWMLRRLTRVGLLVAFLMGAHALSSGLRLSTIAQSADPIGGIEPAAPSSIGRAIPPKGWRRTVDGWQHVSQWTGFEPRVMLTLGQQIQLQRAAQPRVLDEAMTQVRKVPPHWFALGQVSAIAVLFLVSRRDQTCPTGHE